MPKLGELTSERQFRASFQKKQQCAANYPGNFVDNPNGTGLLVLAPLKPKLNPTARLDTGAVPEQKL